MFTFNVAWSQFSNTPVLIIGAENSRIRTEEMIVQNKLVYLMLQQ